MPVGQKIRQLDEQVKAAVRRTVEEVQQDLRGRLEEAVDDLRRRLGEPSPDVPESFVAEEDLEALLSEAREEARAEERRATPAAAPAAPASETLLEAVAAVDRERGQKEILDALVAESGRFAPRALLLLVRPDRLAGWGARGFGIDRDRVRSLALSREDDLWSGMLEGAAGRRLSGDECAALVERLAPADGDHPTDGALVPMVLRDRVSALLYVDRDGSAEDDSVDLPAIQLLTHLAALSLETLTLRERSSTSTLQPIAPLAEPEPEAEPEMVAEEPAATEVLPETSPEVEVEAQPPSPAKSATPPHGDELPTGAPVGLGGAEETAEATAVPSPHEGDRDDDAYELELEVDEEDAEVELVEVDDAGWASPATTPEVEESPEAPAAPAAEARDETVGGFDEFEPLDRSGLEDESLASAPELEEEPNFATGGEAIAWSTEEAGTDDDGEPVRAEVEPELEATGAQEPETVPPPPSGAETTLVPTQPADDQSLSGRETAATPPSASADAEAGEPGAGGQVRPPADVEGPGWAFNETRATVAKGDEAAHEEARRLARLLVSEIQLYNQEEVEEGRARNNIYERLREDIDRSRQLYEERVDPDVRESTDYFYQELVRQLAAGDTKALGI